MADRIAQPKFVDDHVDVPHLLLGQLISIGCRLTWRRVAVSLRMNYGHTPCLPFLAGICGNLFGGWLSDRLVKRFGLKIGRLSIGVTQGLRIEFRQGW